MSYKLIMGNRRYSSWSLRAWLLLCQSGINFDVELIPIYTPEFEKFQADNFPARQVPTLIANADGERVVIWDSMAIAEYVHERNPDAGIWPSNPGARATARCLAAEMHSSFSALRSTMPMNLCRTYKSFQPDIETMADIARIESLWAWVRALYGADGPYLFGETFCAVDAFYVPVATRFHTYRVDLSPQSQRYVDALLAYPSTLEFHNAAQKETWIMSHCEFDIA